MKSEESRAQEGRKEKGVFQMKACLDCSRALSLPGDELLVTLRVTAPDPRAGGHVMYMKLVVADGGEVLYDENVQPPPYAKVDREYVWRAYGEKGLWVLGGLNGAQLWYREAATVYGTWLVLCHVCRGFDRPPRLVQDGHEEMAKRSFREFLHVLRDTARGWWIAREMRRRQEREASLWPFSGHSRSNSRVGY